MRERPLYQDLFAELAREGRMVFVEGPRRVGKTTLGELIGRSYANRLALNGEIPEERARLVRNPAFFEEVERRDDSPPLIVLDEVNRHRGWRKHLKAAYDRAQAAYHFLVTASSRLDHPPRRGDSLAGRYYRIGLWPFTLAETARRRRAPEAFLADPLQMSMEGAGEVAELWQTLSELGGFPEPFLAGRKTAYRRWSNAYAGQLVREEIRDMTGIKALAELETLVHLLPAQVGGLLPVPVLAQTLHVAYNTIRSWLATLQRFFAVFVLTPWTRGVPRAIREGQKLYLYDYPRIADEAARFENMVAVELGRAVATWNATGLGRFALHFVRTKDQQEVDFLVSDDGNPRLLVDAGAEASQPSGALIKFQAALRVPAVHLVRAAAGYRRLMNDGLPLLVAPAGPYLAGLP